jgi:hypothetical protein
VLDQAGRAEQGVQEGVGVLRVSDEEAENTVQLARRLDELGDEEVVGRVVQADDERRRDRFRISPVVEPGAGVEPATY